MKRKDAANTFSLVLLVAAGAGSAGFRQPSSCVQKSSTALTLPEEKHLKNVRQLSFGGQNAEAYFSLDDKYLIFQHQGEGVSCDQIYTISVDPGDGQPATPKLVSTGKGRTTCAYYFP